MGRRDAVQVTLEVIARMRQLEPRLVVSYEPGWETRGNGTSANYEGGLVHHTAGVSSLAKPFPTQKTLRDGRPDLSGPLCNEAGPACTVEQPRIHVMSANPANHAGASGGRSMGPLPVTSLFNPRVRGLEIDYAGTVPMLAGQLYVAHLWARSNADVVGGGDINRIRAHFETSVTGKWDIGFANGKSYDMAAFRRDAANFTATGDDMALTDDDIRRIWSYGIGGPVAEWTGSSQGANNVIADIFHNTRVSAQFGQQAVGALVGGNTDGKNNFHWLAEQFLAAVASIPGAQVDAEALTALTEAIKKSVTFTREQLADDAADEVAERLHQKP